MNDPRPFASLSPSLLARKGQASPAMRRQAYALPTDYQNASHDAASDDLGWNDMGLEDALHSEPVSLHGEPLPIPAEPPVVVAQQAELSREFQSQPEPYQAPTTRALPGSRGKAAFTLRLDGDRHLRLRLVSAVHHRSAQQIVTQALDEFLSRQPSNAELTAQAPKF